MQDANSLELYQGQGKKAPRLDIKFGNKTFYILLMEDGQSDLYNGIEGNFILEEDEPSNIRNDSEIKNLCEKYESQEIREKYKYFFENEISKDVNEDWNKKGIDLKKNNNLFIYNSQEFFDKTLKHCTTITDYIKIFTICKYFSKQPKTKYLHPS
jgi:hypothetical protein